MTNKNVNEMPKMTLKGYYENLPKSTYPKKDFIVKIMAKCNISYTTALNWVKGLTRPQDEDNLKILSEITGIPQDSLWG